MYVCTACRAISHFQILFCVLFMCCALIQIDSQTTAMSYHEQSTSLMAINKDGDYSLT